jgi:putative ABC transport system permease protein
MELGPIFRALMNQKTRFWLITIEVALTLAVVANCVSILLEHRRMFLRSTGLDEENLLVVRTEPFAPEFKDESLVDATREEDLRRLRVFPGVRDATAIQQVPLSGSGSSSSYRPVGSEIDDYGTPYYVVANHALQTLGVELVAGRDFTAEDFLGLQDNGGSDEPRNVILTQELADLMFPDGDAVGQQIEAGPEEPPDTIIGVIREMHCSWPTSIYAGRVMLRPGKPGTDRRMIYMVRTEPGSVDAVFPRLEEVLIGVNPGRIVTVRTLTHYKLRTYDDSLAIIKMLGGVIVLLVTVTSLGIVGLTSFSVSQRTRQIGTRRALGATKVDIVRYFLVESWMINGIGLVIGTGLALALSYGLGQMAGTPKLDWSLLAGGVLFLWLTGIIAALIPSLRATAVPPELATRTV